MYHRGKAAAEYQWWWWQADRGKGLNRLVGLQKQAAAKIKAGWRKDHPLILATIPPPEPTGLGMLIARLCNAVGGDQFLSKKEWLTMNGVVETNDILSICAGGDAYQNEFERLAKVTFEKESKE